MKSSFPRLHIQSPTPSGNHEHPDGPMLGFVIPEHEVANADSDAGPSLCHARASPD